MYNTSQNKTMLTVMHYYELLCTKGFILFSEVDILQLSHIILIQKISSWLTIAVTSGCSIVFNFVG